MRAHYLQHIPFEGLGSIAPWLEASGYEITGTKLFESAKYPNLKEIDLLVILGGPMSINDKDEFSWLASENNLSMNPSIQEASPGYLSWCAAYCQCVRCQTIP